MKKNNTLIRLSSWEYWPMWVLYVPVVFQHLWLSLRAGSPFFPLKTNPVIREGFILSDSKYKSLQLIPKPFRPATILLPAAAGFLEKLDIIQSGDISYPLILKPDIGFRGLAVHHITDVEQLKSVLRKVEVDYLVQEYIEFPLEVGVFYYRLPSKKKGVIPSLTLKEFLEVTGDGLHTLEELVLAQPRARLQHQRLLDKFGSKMKRVPGKGIRVTLETIGNHNRGTKFLNGNHVVDEELVHAFDQLNSTMPGFYFGRFDIRTSSLEDLKKGRNFKVLEVNGIGAEPTHVYDPSYSLINAWKDMAAIYRVMFKIAMENKRKGEEFPVFSDVKARYLQYRNYKRTAFTVN